MERKSTLATLVVLALGGLAIALPAAAQQCTVTLRMFNHNRYVYDSDEECPGTIHSAPFGNWGVSSNVGTKVDGGQFQGWNGTCAAGAKVEWNSCTNGYVRPDPDCRRLNYPHPTLSFPKPPGYPTSDIYAHNNCATGTNPCRCVDQVSPCGANDYGGFTQVYNVPAPFDSDCDGTYDTGGCRYLDGRLITVANNFMTVYELDPLDDDELVQSLYYPNLTVRLKCNRESCWAATGDANKDGTQDDLSSRTSPAWVWPTAYYDDFNQLRKRIDATIRIGYIKGSYSGPESECNQDCLFCTGPICDPRTQICNQCPSCN
jgi:hypothetical protein